MLPKACLWGTSCAILPTDIKYPHGPVDLVVTWGRESVSGYPLYYIGFLFHAFWSAWMNFTIFIHFLLLSYDVVLVCWPCHAMSLTWPLWSRVPIQPCPGDCYELREQAVATDNILTDVVVWMVGQWGGGWFNSWPLVIVRHLAMEDVSDVDLAFRIYKETLCNYQRLLDNDSVQQCGVFHIFSTQGPLFLLGLDPRTPYSLKFYC